MANYLDYLDWYGDLGLDQTSFNEVDALVLANLSYVDLAGAVPAPGEGSVSCAEAAPAYQSVNGKASLYSTPSFSDPVVELVPQKMAAGRRFAGARLGNYVAELDAATAEQFAALTIELSDGTVYVSFRGTDDTLVGWHENFDMSYEVVPAQTRAVRYLDEVAARTEGPIMVGGHSKGGNLAVFAAALAKPRTRERIARIWDMDGPGFDRKVIAGLEYAQVEDRVALYVPTFDIVGQLLCRQEPTKVVASSARGMMQHSSASWEVLGGRLVAAERQEIDPSALAYSKDFNEWFHDASDATRAQVFQEFFGALAASRIQTLTQLCSGNPRMLLDLLRHILTLEPTAQRYVVSLVIALAGSYIGEYTDIIGKSAKGLIDHLRGKDRLVLDPDAPLSAEELSAYRRQLSSRRALDDILDFLGETRAERLRTATVLAVAASMAVIALRLIGRRR